MSALRKPVEAMRGYGFGLFVLAAVVALIASTAGCKVPPPSFTGLAASPTAGQAGGFTVLGPDATFTADVKWEWQVPAFTMGHIWGKAYNKNGQSVRSDLMMVYREK